MAEHLSGYQPEHAHQDRLPVAGNGIGDIEGVHSLFAPDELEQMRQSAATIAADMETRQELIVPSPPDETIPIFFAEADSEEGSSPVWE